MNPTDITMLGSMPPIKGISKYTVNLCEAIARKRNVQFLSFRSIYPKFLYPGNPVDAEAAVPIIEGVRIETKIAWYNPFSWISAGIGIQGKVLHAQWWSYVLAPVYFTILTIARLRRIPIILTVHNVLPHDSGFLKKLLNESVIRKADRVIVHTEENRIQLLGLKRFQLPDSCVHVIPHGIMFHQGKTILKKEEARKRLGIPSKDRVALVFGNIREYKGVDISILAIGELLRAGYPVRLIIAGKPWKDWRTYNDLIVREGLEDLITLDLEYLSDERIDLYFQATDIVLLNYRKFDSQSGVGSVALPYQKPMIVSPFGGLPDYIDHNPLGIASPFPLEIASRVRRIFEDPTAAEELKKSMKLAESVLSWKSIAQKTEEIYHSLE